VATGETYYLKRSRTVCYLSAEFLMGPQLGNNLVNLGVYDEVRKAMKDAGLDLEELLDQEGSSPKSVTGA
jgi:starch phosphorylase